MRRRAAALIFDTGVVRAVKALGKRQVTRSLESAVWVETFHVACRHYTGGVRSVAEKCMKVVTRMSVV